VIAERVHGICKVDTVSHVPLYAMTMSRDFILNMEQCYLLFPAPDMPASDAVGQFKHITTSPVRVIITTDTTQQRDLRKIAADPAKMLVVPDSHEITSLLLSPDPQETFAKLIASYVEVTHISPYMTGGALNKESLFFGRGQILADIMNREPANYLILGTRQIGKSSLLYAIERRYRDNPDVDCHYIQLDYSGDIRGKLAEEFNWHDLSLEDMLARLGRVDSGKYRLLLIDEADRFVVKDAADGYRVLSRFRSLSHEGRCYFILAGFWSLYHHVFTADYQSPVKNFGEIIHIGALEKNACRELATKPMAALNFSYDSDSLAERIITETGQRANLIAIACDQLIRSMDIKRGK